MCSWSSNIYVLLRLLCLINFRVPLYIVTPCVASCVLWSNALKSFIIASGCFSSWQLWGPMNSGFAYDWELKVLRGCLIPIINKTFIELSTTAYPFSLSFLVSSWNSTSCPRLGRASKSYWLQLPSPEYRKIKLLRRTTNPRKIPRMLMCRCSDIVAPCTRYSRTHRNVKPPGRCGLNRPLPIEKEDSRKTWLSVAVHTRQVCNDVQAYKA